MAGLRDLEISSSLTIPARFLSVRYSRAGGPGGQHVNKVATRAEVRLGLDAASQVLSEEQIARIREVLQNRLDADGNLLVVSAVHRSQARNLEAALARMEQLIHAALQRRKKRRPTRPTAASRRRRLQEKRRRGEVKRRRGKPPAAE
jgi:ribosome-associated protein